MRRASRRAGDRFDAAECPVLNALSITTPIGPQCLLLAHLRHSKIADGLLLSGEERSCSRGAQMTEFDPSATLAVRCGQWICCPVSALSKYSFEPIQCWPLSL